MSSWSPQISLVVPNVLAALAYIETARLARCGVRETLSDAESEMPTMGAQGTLQVMPARQVFLLHRSSPIREGTMTGADRRVVHLG
jgi:hypothetical protein